MSDDNDRTVHAELADGHQIVRYDRAGKWYREGPDGRMLLNVAAAANYVESRDEWRPDVPGGQVFDSLVRRRLISHVRPVA